MISDINNFIDEINEHFKIVHKIILGSTFVRIVGSHDGKKPFKSLNGNDLFFDREEHLQYVYGQVHCYHGNIIGENCPMTKGKSKFIGERLDLYLLELVLPILKTYNIKSISFGPYCYYIDENRGIFTVEKYGTGLEFTGFDLESEIEKHCKIDN